MELAKDLKLKEKTKAIAHMSVMVRIIFRLLFHDELHLFFSSPIFSHEHKDNQLYDPNQLVFQLENL